MMTDPVTARPATVEEIRDLRWRILRPGRPRSTAIFDGDDDPRTLHVGAFAGRICVGCASLMASQWDGQKAWHLRGMAVADPYQRRGIGKLVLAALEDLARQNSPAILLWCNAREEAVEFYRKNGWEIASERFHIEDVGPHFKMIRHLGAV